MVRRGKTKDETAAISRHCLNGDWCHYYETIVFGEGLKHIVGGESQRARDP